MTNKKGANSIFGLGGDYQPVFAKQIFSHDDETSYVVLLRAYFDEDGTCLLKYTEKFTKNTYLGFACRDLERIRKHLPLDLIIKECGKNDCLLTQEEEIQLNKFFEDPTTVYRNDDDSYIYLKISYEE